MPRGLGISLLFAACAWAAAPTLEEASKLYQRTDYEGSLAVLAQLPDKSARVFALTGQNQFMLGDYKKASESYQQSVQLEPGNSAYENALGKAYGKRAETASPFTAAGLAAKARQHFERAVTLDSHNKEALNDLFEYYMEAPGFLGGGLDKAGQLAAHIATLDSAEGLWAQARIAERRKDYGKAEEQLRRAMQAAPSQVGRALDLARFLSKQGRIEESEQTFRAAERIAPNNPRLLYVRAETYIKSGRNIDTARVLLKRYLSAQLSPDDPSRQDAEKLLQKAGS